MPSVPQTPDNRLAPTRVTMPCPYCGTASTTTPRNDRGILTANYCCPSCEHLFIVKRSALVA